MMDYKSPFELFIQDCISEQEGLIMKCVQKIGVSCDKEELIKALKYDRNQYEVGYADGKADAVRHGKWQYIDEDEWQCSQCLETVHTTNPNWTPLCCDLQFCSHCGADMR